MIAISVKINWLFLPIKVLSNFENETRFLSYKPKQKFEIVMPFDLYSLAGIFWQQGPPLVVVSSSSICTVQGRWNQGRGRGDDLCQPYSKQGVDYYFTLTDFRLKCFKIMTSKSGFLSKLCYCGYAK